jgi:hypothetical protein
LDPTEIFELIIKADEAVKYATAEKTAVRAQQARNLLLRARDEATAIGNDGLVEQAERRLADLGELRGEADGADPAGG